MEIYAADPGRPRDLTLLGRAAIDFNPAWNEQVKEDFKPLQDVHTFEMFLGGSPANIAVGTARLGLKIGFFGAVSADAFGDFILSRFRQEGIDTSRLFRAANQEKLGLTFTEMLSPQESHILMYRTGAADLALRPQDIDEAYIAGSRALLISGCALSQSPSREAALKAVQLAERVHTPVFFDLDYRPYSWKSTEETSLYYSLVAEKSVLIMGSREEYDLAEAVISPGMSDAESADYWTARKARICLIKHGGEGSRAYGADGSCYAVKPFPVKARKGFGGGDGYAAGFLYGLFQGWPLRDCLEFGDAEASMMVRANNCSDSLPHAQEVVNFIQEEKKQFGERVVSLE
jgi:5-dehydro-2-deoxygluconokinase